MILDIRQRTERKGVSYSFQFSVLVPIEDSGSYSRREFQPTILQVTSRGIYELGEPVVSEVVRTYGDFYIRIE